MEGEGRAHGCDGAALARRWVVRVHGGEGVTE